MPDDTADVAGEVELFWRRFCVARGVDPTERHDAFAFGDSPAMHDELLELVLQGSKRATAGLVLEFHAERLPLPSVRGYSVVLDGQSRPRCVIRTTQVDVVPFREVDERFARDEGEDDRSLASWRDGHERYFRRACARLDRRFTEDLPVVLERFELAWVDDAA